MRHAIGAFPTSTDRITLADLWTFTLVTGAAYRLTSFDQSLVYGALFSAGTVLSRGPTRLKMGLEVDDLTLDVGCGTTATIAGYLWPQAATMGLLDGAIVKLERAYMVTPPTVQCTVSLFEGFVSEVEASHTEVHIVIRSQLEILNSQWPVNLYMPTCSKRVFTSPCGLISAAFEVSGPVSGGSVTGFTCAAAAGKPAGYWALGKATFTSGPLTGVQMGIKDSSGSIISLVGPLPLAASGDVTLMPGCDKTQATCNGKYNNLARFKGFPWIPQPETAR